MILRGMNLPLIVACAIIILAIIIFPLIVSHKAEKENKSNKNTIPKIPKTEWDKIKEYGKQINKKTKDNK